ncbi:MAG TPA: HEAT repeat domain-containing protein [Anaerolineales bacterium]|jgi:HEAT repeat protein
MTGLELLCAELRSGDDQRAEAAATRLPEYGVQGLEALRRLLNDQDPDVRWWVIRALAGFDDQQAALPELLAALGDASAEVRQAAALVFCHHPQPLALNELAQVLADPDAMVARLASSALVRLGKDATGVLLEVLKDGPRPAKLEAARALAEIRDPRAIPGLMKALETDSALMQYWAGIGLDQMGAGMVYLRPE